MPRVATFDRNQMMMCSWDFLVDQESTARIIDAFVNSLDLTKYDIKEAAKEGRPSYDPKGMYKLFIYGNRNGLRSSRKLATSCKVNLEVKWMLGGVEPDFRTISDFRKENIESMKEIFHDFNSKLAEVIQWGYCSIDGSKFLANNGKDNNFTKNKLDDRIKWLDIHSEEYLRILEEMDKEEEIEEGTEEKLTKEQVEGKLKEAQERLAKYESYQKIMEESGISQLSLIDVDARLMKNKNGFAVAYNPQTAVDSETHLIRDFAMTNQVTDHGMLEVTMEDIRKKTEGEILEVVADRGYESSEDMIHCLENGIIPHVITADGKDGYELEIPYEEEEEIDKTSTDAEEIKKCLHMGEIPDAYKEVITKIEVKEVRRKEKEETTETEKITSPYGTIEQMKEKAKEGYFVRDPERNLVYCPMGEILRQKCIRKNGTIRYANKNACRHCPNRNKCYQGKNEWKEVDFTKDTLEKPCKPWLEAQKSKEIGTKEKEQGSVADSTEQKSTIEEENVKKPKVKYKKVKVVKFFFQPNRLKTAQRMCLSEHPFGTIKRAMGAAYFLLRGTKKVTGEFALFCLGYNIERAKNLLGFEKMMEIMATS